MSDKITGVCVNIPTVIHEAKYGRWISVEDRLPLPMQDVLCYSGNGSQYVTYYVEDDDYVDPEEGYKRHQFVKLVTHWQYLPEPPKV